MAHCPGRGQTCEALEEVGSGSGSPLTHVVRCDRMHGFQARRDTERRREFSVSPKKTKGGRRTQQKRKVKGKLEIVKKRTTWMSSR